MSLQDLQQTALQVLQDGLKSSTFPTQEKLELALKILALQIPTKSPQDNGLTASSELSESLENPAQLAVPELYSLSPAWQKWLVENKLRGVSDQSLVEILVGQGITEEVAYQVVFALPQEVSFAYIQPQWRSLQKYRTIAEVYRHQAANQNLSLEQKSSLTKAEFEHHYDQVHRPVLITDLGKEEPWHTRDSFVEQYGDRPVAPKPFPVLHSAQPKPQIPLTPTPQRIRDFASQGEPTGYLHCDLGDFDGIGNPSDHYPDLKNYLPSDPELPGTATLQWQSAVSALPLQAKEQNLFVVQLWGESQWHLVSPWESEFLYGDEQWSSLINLEDPNLNRYPLCKQVHPHRISLKAGQGLFIPSFWWQQCRALGDSAQVIYAH